MTEKTPLLPLRVYPVELNAFELGLLWGALVKNGLVVPDRIKEATRKIYTEQKEVK